MPVELTRILANYVKRTNFNDLPKRVVEFAKKAILDFSVVALAGSPPLALGNWLILHGTMAEGGIVN